MIYRVVALDTDISTINQGAPATLSHENEEENEEEEENEDEDEDENDDIEDEWRYGG